MKELELLESELVLMQDTIKRLKKYIKEEPKTLNSLVVGELKHRSIALKQRLTIINKLSTYAYWR